MKGRTHRLRLASLGGLLVISGLVYMLNASIPGRRVEGCLQGCAETEQGEAASLRVLSLNVLHGHPDFEWLPERLNMIAAQIERLDVDIALLQEVPWTAQLKSGMSYLASRSGMNSAYLRANGNRWLIRFEEGEAILSRYPLVFVGRSELKPAAGFFENRVVLHAIAQTPGGALDLYVTHLTNGEERVNQGQVDSLLAYVRRTVQHIALIAGDFNALPDSPQMRNLSAVWQDAYHSANPDLPGFTCCIDDLNARDAELSKRIDYIFIASAPGEPVRINQARVVFNQPQRLGEGWLWSSDHAGVLVEIDF